MGDQPKRYRLKLSRLDFVSLVDDPAQPNAKTLLLKRKGAEVEGETHAKFVKASDELGLAFFWAFTSTNPDGSDHFDHHGDTIDQGFIKAAMDFMLDGGGAVDEMHDGQATNARVAFAMPMIPDIARAFSIETKQSGLMVALKVTDEQLAKLKDGTYTGVSIAGLGIREPVAARKSAEKRYFTDETLGHQHEVCVYDDGYPWMTDATVEGGAAPHRHTVTRAADGSLTVLADSGHTHTLTEMPRVIVAPEDAVVVTEEKRSPSTNAPARATSAAKSTGLAAGRNVTSHTKESTMDPTKELEDLKARLAAVEAALAEKTVEAEMTDEEKAHAAKLDGTEQKRFRGLAKSERLAEVAKAKAADPVVATIDGVEYRKSTPGAQLAQKLAAQQDAIDKTEVRSIAKSHLGSLTGDDNTHDLIVRSLRKSGAPQAEIDAALTAMKGWNEIAKSKTKAAGASGEDVEKMNTGTAALKAAVLEYQKANGIEHYAVAFNKAIASDPKVRRLYAESNA